MVKQRAKVNEDILCKTFGMNPYERKHFLFEQGVLNKAHWYGYGIYGGVYITGKNEIEYQRGDSCD